MKSLSLSVSVSQTHTHMSTKAQTHTRNLTTSTGRRSAASLAHNRGALTQDYMRTEPPSFTSDLRECYCSADWQTKPALSTNLFTQLFISLSPSLLHCSPLKIEMPAEQMDGENISSLWHHVYAAAHKHTPHKHTHTGVRCWLRFPQSSKWHTKHGKQTHKHTLLVFWCFWCNLLFTSCLCLHWTRTHANTRRTRACSCTHELSKSPD